MGVRIGRNHQSHFTGDPKCNAGLAAPWNSQRVVENALGLHGGRFFRALLVCAITRGEMHLECQAQASLVDAS